MLVSKADQLLMKNKTWRNPFSGTSQFYMMAHRVDM